MQRLYKRHILRAAILPAALTIAVIAALFFPSSAAYATTDKGAEVTYTTRSDAQLEKDYLDWYGVSTDSEEEIIDRVKGMFSDYMQTKLLPEFNDRETILSLEEQLSGHPLYEGNLDRYIQRALSVLDGTLMTDVVNRQFTTDPAARGNFIQQRGDIFADGQDLHFIFGLSNYMPTGIYGNTGEQITIYVEADEGQPLPKVAFTQFLTTYQYWQGSKIELQRGINVLTVPSFTHTASYTNAGGPLYIVNPYTSATQNKSVKLYIEGGHAYPVFYEGGSKE